MQAKRFRIDSGDRGYVDRALLEVDFLLVVVEPQAGQQVQALGYRPIQLAEHGGGEGVELRRDLAARSGEVVIDHRPTRPHRDIGAAIRPRRWVPDKAEVVGTDFLGVDGIGFELLDKPVEAEYGAEPG
ncbi:hypothetical protein [Aquimonas sp.]|uniref:hypothetical protein n=1 Tax=Aquimonas sp. TaxID=1872588 RepID=UPI0037BF7A37